MKRASISISTLGIAIAVIVILFLVMLPHYKMAVEKAAARSSMIDMNVWADAIEDYTQEHMISPSNPNGSINYKKELVTQVLPYLRVLRIKDWWGNPYWIWTEGAPAQHGFSLDRKGDYLIVSLGSDGIRENWIFNPEDPGAGYFEARSFSDFENDLILYNHEFVRIPERDRSREK